MIKRPADSRGHRKADWIDSRRTFSFPNYWDPRYMNFSDLQTINDDRVRPNGHVPHHEHKNMEIFGYVVEGSCQHTDNRGNNIDIPAGSVQRMTCGTGIQHTEGNSGTATNRYLQLWIRPSVTDTEPKHEWHQFTREDKLNRFCDITEYLPIKQDARLLAGIFTKRYLKMLDSTRRYYLYVVTGTGSVNGDAFIEGDGYAFTGESSLEIDSEDSEIILFDLR